MKKSFIKHALIAGATIFTMAGVAVFAQTNIETNIFNAWQTIIRTTYTTNGSQNGSILMDINNGSGIFIANEMLTGSRGTRILGIDGDNNIRLVPGNICSMVETVFACTIDPDGSQNLCPAVCINNGGSSGSGDHDWYVAGTNQSPTNINQDIYTYGQVGIGMQNPTVPLQVSGSVVFGNTTNIIGNINSFSSILGGQQNNLQAGWSSIIVGGEGNTVQGDSSFIGGGVLNTIQARYKNNIVGGEQNRIEGSTSNSNIVGGIFNRINLNNSNNNGNRGLSIVGGEYNTITGSAISRSLIGGGGSNTITDNASASSIVGGIRNTVRAWASAILGGEDNSITINGIQSSIAGGIQNTINDGLSVIGGGGNNTTNARGSVIGGGEGNQTLNLGDKYDDEYPTIGGGFENTIGGKMGTIGGGLRNTIYGTFSTIAGGNQNEIQADNGFIGGGNENLIDNNQTNSTIGGGLNNRITNIGGGNSGSSTIAGGAYNEIDGTASSIGGGNQNIILGGFSIIGGGYMNIIEGDHSGILGGNDNQILSYVSNMSSIIGGSNNRLTGGNSTILGGTNFQLSGSRSMGFGINASINADEVFLWSPGVFSTNTASIPNTFIVYTDGVGINTNTPQKALDVNGAIVSSQTHINLSTSAAISIDAAAINSVIISADPGETITINSISNGVAGQVLYIAKDSVNNQFNLEIPQSGDIAGPGGVNIIGPGWGGLTLLFDGNKRIIMSINA